jgi:hypothetical protein
LTRAPKKKAKNECARIYLKQKGELITRNLWNKK